MITYTRMTKPEQNYIQKIAARVNALTIEQLLEALEWHQVRTVQVYRLMHRLHPLFQLTKALEKALWDEQQDPLTNVFDMTWWLSYQAQAIVKGWMDIEMEGNTYNWRPVGDKS